MDFNDEFRTIGPMCNHYVEPESLVIDWLTSSYPPLTRDGDVEAVPFEKWPKYNGHIVCDLNGQRVVTVGRWGVRGTDDKGKTTFVTNARNDTMLRGVSMWKESLAIRRCLVPASCYFEPGIGPVGARGELRFTIKGKPWFFMAGLWEPDPFDNGRRSFAIVTTEPNTYAARFHDRMPVVLSDEAAGLWVGSEPLPRETIKSLLNHCPDDWMHHEVLAAAPRVKKAPEKPKSKEQTELF